MIKTATSIAAVLALAGCSYNAESSFLGYRSSISYSTPGAYPPPSPPPGPPPSGYQSTPPGYQSTPPGPPPSYSPQTSCYRQGHYNRWGYWVPGGYRC